MAAADANPFAPRRDEFDDWFHTPVPATSPDPRIEVRRAHPSEFDRIYDVIDDAFGFKRPRALNEWAYRHNPHGLAHCWVIVDRATTECIGAFADWPWPLARGPSPLRCAQGGDVVLLRRWQDRGIYRIAAQVRRSDPWVDSTVVYGWPNANSAEHLRRQGSGLIGVLSSAILPLRARPYLIRRGLPQAAVAVAAPLLDTLFTSWSTLLLRRPFNGHVEQVGRFDGDFDEVTRRCMSWQGYWSPHDAGFLNWRYLRDPLREHLAFALTVGARLIGYSVIRVASERAHLMEFAVPPEQPRAARALLLHTINAAAAAGCSQLAVAAPPGWRHWQLLRAAGFMRRASTLFMYASSRRDDTPGVDALENWQILGGDFDPFYD